MKLLGSILLTMVFGVVVYLITGSHLCAAITGIVGGIGYSRGLHE